MYISTPEIAPFLTQEQNEHYRAGVIAYLQDDNPFAAIEPLLAAGEQHAAAQYLLGRIKETSKRPEIRREALTHYQNAFTHGYRPARLALQILQQKLTPAAQAAAVANHNPLHLKVLQGALITIGELIADQVTTPDADGYTPYHYAVIRGDKNNVDIFNQWNARQRDCRPLNELKTTRNESVYHLAAAHAQCELLAIWLEGEPNPALKRAWLNQLDDNELTPLHHALASRKEDPTMLDLLIKHGAEINKVGDNRLSCLHYAIQHPWSDQYNIRFCLIQGANRFQGAADGNTPELALQAAAIPDLAKNRLCNMMLPFTAAQRIALPIKQLVFKGGGAKGAAYCGVVEALAELDILAGINKVAGASAGAITAAILGIGCTFEEIQEYQNADFRQFKDGNPWYWGGMLGDITRLVREGGLYPGDYLRSWLGSIIEKKLGKPNATFADLHQRVVAQDANAANAGEPYRYRDMYIVVANVTRGQEEYWSYETQPDLAIADAVRASVAIPGFFTPISVERDQRTGALLKEADGRLRIILNPRATATAEHVVDGGTFDNYPIKIFDRGGVPNFNTLGFLLVDENELVDFRERQRGLMHNMSSFWKYITNLGASVAFDQQVSSHIHSADQFRTIYLGNCGVGTVEFDLNTPEKKPKKTRLIQTAKRATREYILQRYQTLNLSGQALPTPAEQLLRLNHLERKAMLQKCDYVCAGRSDGSLRIQLVFSIAKCKDPLTSVRKYRDKLKLQTEIDTVNCYRQDPNTCLLEFICNPEIYSKFEKWSGKYQGASVRVLIDTRRLEPIPERDYMALNRINSASMQYLYACETGDTATIERLLNQEHVPIDFTDLDGNNALHWAAKGKQLEVLRLLMTKYLFKAIQLRNRFGQSAWQLAGANLQTQIQAFG